MQKNKNSILIIIGVIVVAIIVILVTKNNKQPQEVTQDPLNNTTDQVVETDVKKPIIKKPTSTTPTLSYEDALVQYGDRRIQIDQACQAVPNNVTYKNGTSVMIDNRSNTDRVFRVGSNYTIKAWSFKIINLTSSTLPATWLIDCGAQQNVATILIQK